MDYPYHMDACLLHPDVVVVHDCKKKCLRSFVFHTLMYLSKSFFSVSTSDKSGSRNRIFGCLNFPKNVFKASLRKIFFNVCLVLFCIFQSNFQKTETQVSNPSLNRTCICILYSHRYVQWHLAGECDALWNQRCNSFETLNLDNPPKWTLGQVLKFLKLSKMAELNNRVQISSADEESASATL